MKILMLLLCLAHADLETPPAANVQTAENTPIECLAKLQDLVAVRPETYVPRPGALQRLFSICRKSKPLAENLSDQFKAAGYANPKKELGELSAEADPHKQLEILKARLPKLTRKQTAEALEALNGSKQIQEEIAKPTASASLEEDPPKAGK